MTNLDTLDLSGTGPPTKQHTLANMRPPKIYIVADCWVWVHLEKMNLALKRLEAPGSGEVWWDCGRDMIMEKVWDVEWSEGGLAGE